MTNKIVEITNSKKDIFKVCLDFKEIGYRLSHLKYTGDNVILYFEKINSKFEYNDYIQFLSMLKNDL